MVHTSEKDLSVRRLGTGMSGDTARDRERDERGRYRETLSPGHVLEALRRAGEPMTATELAEEFDVTNRAILNKLDGLHEQGDVERKEVGARAVVWWVSDEAPAEKAPLTDDPLFDLPTGASGHTDVSERIDEHVAAAVGETSADSPVE